MYNHGLHQHINKTIQQADIHIGGVDNPFYTRFMANASVIFELYMQIYEHHPLAEQYFDQLVQLITRAYTERSTALKERDLEKTKMDHWFLSNELAGMSLYVDRFCGTVAAWRRSWITSRS